MANFANYSRDGTHSGQYYHAQISSTNSDPGHPYESGREMGPPPLEYPPPPMEIDLNSRVLPNPSLPHSWDAALLPSTGYGDMQPVYGSQGVNRTPSFPGETQNRAPTQDPILKWYTGNDGPWIPQGISAVMPDERRQDRHESDRITVPFGGQYRQSNPSETGTQQYGVPPSDSGYGTRRSIGTASVFGAELTEHPDQDCQSLAGHMGDFPSFQGMDILHPHDTRGNESWDHPTPITAVPAFNRLICPTCEKPVKTRSELKKHELRHTKPFVCEFTSCTRKEGFGTSNDLDRHTKSKHPTMIPNLESTKMYRCQVQGCKSKDKLWPRLDNFRSHLKRLHMMRNEDQLNTLVRRAEYLERSVPSSRSKEQGKASFNGNSQEPSYPLAFNAPSRHPDDKHNTLNSWDHGHPETCSSSLVSATIKRPPPTDAECQTGQTATLRSEGPAQDNKAQEIIQPREVYKQAISESIIPSPVGLIDAAKKLDRTGPQPTTARKLVSGKNTKEDTSTADATIAEALRTVLAGSRSAEQTDKHVSVGDSDSRSPQDARLYPEDSRVSGPNLATSSTGTLSENLDRGERASTKDTSDDDQAKQNVLEILKVLREQGYTVQKDPSFSSTPKIHNSGSVAGNKSENQVTCQRCKRFKGRPCELKKHMKRHERPYGCTFPTCNKVFGSKNDWKRHENTQHFQLETWRCNEDKPRLAGGGACAKVCYRRQAFRDHLCKDHEISNIDIVNHKVESCHIGRNCQARFWCGFCVKTIDLKKKGLEAWTERFNHIDDHFMGRDRLPERRITDWVPVDSDKPKGSVDISQSLGASSSEDERESPSSSGSSSKNSPEATGSPASASVRESKKRPAIDEDANQPRKQARKNTRVEIVACCQCNVEHTAKINQSCTVCEDEHRFCANCKHGWSDSRHDLDV